MTGHQAITWANFYPDLCRHMAPLCHNESTAGVVLCRHNSTHLSRTTEYVTTSSTENIFRVTGNLWGEIFSALLAICEGHPPVTCSGFPSKRPVSRSFDNFFDLRLNKRWGKQSRLVIKGASTFIMTPLQWHSQSGASIELCFITMTS